MKKGTQAMRILQWTLTLAGLTIGKWNGGGKISQWITSCLCSKFTKSRLKISFLILISGLGAHAQPYETNPDFNRTRNWHFGHGVGLRFDPDTIYQVPTSIHTDEAAAVHTDQDGNLLLYSNGEKIWNANHEVIHNGNLSLGHSSSRMGSVFVFHEDNPDSIYLFNTYYNISTTKQFSVNLIVKEADTFRVAYKDSVLMYSVCEPIAVVKADNGRDIWITVHEFEANNLYSYLLTSQGIISCPVVSKSFSTPAGGAQGAAFPMVFSLSGNYLIKVNTNIPPLNRIVEIYQFDKSLGGAKFLYTIDSIRYPVLGLSFSKDNSRLYIVERDSGLNVFDFDPNDSASTVSSKRKFYVIGFSFELQSITYKDKFALSLMDSNNLVLVENRGLIDSTKITIQGIDMGINKITYGLPNFVKSYFHTPSINFAYELDCISNTIQFHGQDTFQANTHSWEISKQGSSAMTASIKNPLIELTDTGVYSVRYVASNGSRSDTITKTVDILPKITSNFLGNDTGWCENSNGSITLTAPSSMHCYQWNTGATGDEITTDTAGVYIVKITTPNFCVLYDTLVISIDTLPYIEPDFLGDNINWCENLDTSVILKAPDNMLSYLWNTGDTIQQIQTDSAGIYWVKITPHKYCALYDTVIVSIDTLPNVGSNFLGGNISWCENIDTSVILAAPTDMLQYLWSTNDTIQQIEISNESVYWVTVTAHNLCVFSDTLTVSIDTLPDIAPDFLGDNINWCENLDTSVMLIAPADMLSYLWNTNETTQEIEVSNAGTYWVKITAHNLCVLNDTITITLDTVPNAPTIYKDSDTLKTAAAASNYQWFRYGQPVGSNQNHLILTDTGVYRLMITNTFGCSSAFSDTIHVPDTANISVSTILFKNIKLYPNPASTELTFEIAESGNYVYEIIGIAGNLIMKVQLQAGVNTIDISRINAGIYLVHVFDGKRWIMHAKLSICKE
ncbi:MAG: T9SS type A sorting domain-containing protein [Bacteroidia bacterium]|nr:T9SS type A sorting domain-containing protein [Bacteroidia bacterium]MCO5254785.1 T9SS type A sorting domain-containing protein [Bacteroidota bacterium]